jgi:hypothetical protein
VYGGDLVAGSVIMPSGTFDIRPAPETVRAANPQPRGAVHFISEIDQSALPPEAEPIIPTPAQGLMAAAGDLATQDAAGTIDVMVVYTALAQQHAGGALGIVNLINLGISLTNASYANSDIKQRVRLVHRALVPYAEVSSFSTNLGNLRQGGGTLSTVPALRNEYKADLVMLLIHPPSPDFCGIAYLMANVSVAFESSGYSVTDTACVSNLTVAHEWGHNMGAHHDWYVSPGIQPYTYAHGYANTRPGQRWRTVMSYNDACTDKGFSCTRLVAWSNPDFGLRSDCSNPAFSCLADLWYVPGVGGTGVPRGTSSDCVAGVTPVTDCDADNHRTLNNTAFTVANFRQSASSTTSHKR